MSTVLVQQRGNLTGVSHAGDIRAGGKGANQKYIFTVGSRFALKVCLVARVDRALLVLAD